VPAREQERAASNSLASDSVAPKTRQKTALGSTASEAKEAGFIGLRGGEFSTGEMGNFHPALRLRRWWWTAGLDALEK
jgi:hypothetical protein